jgi:tetratricopeptide (TPR) repeat protein
MNDSKIAYQVQTLDKRIECPDYSKKLNYHNSYQISKDSSHISVISFHPNDNAKPYFDKAEELFQSKKFEDAIEAYKMALTEDSTLYNVMTYIGQIYENKNDYFNAVQWYQKAIRKNYIDYMAHWFLADAYFRQKDLNHAVEEIVIAKILNRNNPRIQQSMNSIFNQAKLKIDDWYFNPQIEINETAPGKVKVAMDEKWMAYGMAKALWIYEPGYKELMGISKDQHSIIEDRECLVSLIIGLENAKIKIKKDAQLRILKQAAENNYLDQYILYELWLPQNPYIAYTLPEKTISSIKDYILKIRNK